MQSLTTKTSKLTSHHIHPELYSWHGMHCQLQNSYEVLFRDQPQQMWVGTEEPATCANDEVTIMAVAAGICGTDVRVYSGERPVPPGRIGHEAVAMIVEVGETAYKKGFRVGTLVIIDCNHPNNAMRDRHLDAALGRFYRVPCDFVMAMPQERLVAVEQHLHHKRFSLAFAAIVEPMTVALHAIDYLRQGKIVQREDYDQALVASNRVHIPTTNKLKNKNIVVTGAGSIAVFAAMLARVSGAKTVTIINRDLQRLEHARSICKPDFAFQDDSLVTEKIVSATKDIGGVDYVLVASHVSAVINAFSYINEHATIIMVAGIPKDGVLKTDHGEVALYPIRHDDHELKISVDGKAYTLMGAHGTNEPLFREVMTYEATGVFEKYGLRPTDQITHIVSLQALPEVFALVHAKELIHGRLVGKVLIDFRLVGNEIYTRAEYETSYPTAATELFTYAGIESIKLALAEAQV